ncbi:hypothetical protein AAVH_10805 [Aphelenchoides avenae]|nr:hypothetical protein AAVH_10805 [Aphelenchus avenae]
MSSVKVLIVGTIVRDGNTEVEKNYAFVFQSDENAMVASLLQRLQTKSKFSDSTLSLAIVVTVDKDFATEVE